MTKPPDVVDALTLHFRDYDEKMMWTPIPSADRRVEDDKDEP